MQAQLKAVLRRNKWKIFFSISKRLFFYFFKNMNSRLYILFLVDKSMT